MNEYKENLIKKINQIKLIFVNFIINYVILMMIFVF